MDGCRLKVENRKVWRKVFHELFVGYILFSHVKFSDAVDGVTGMDDCRGFTLGSG